jgi:hypothetical protein
VCRHSKKVGNPCIRQFKVNAKLVPVAPLKHIGGVEARRHAVLASALDEGSGQLHDPAKLPPVITWIGGYLGPRDGLSYTGSPKFKN